MPRLLLKSGIPIINLMLVLILTACNNKADNRKTDHRFKNVDFSKFEAARSIPIADSAKAVKINVLDIFSNDRFRLLKLDAIIDSIKFIPLETGKNFLIASIDKLLFYKNRIIILDNRTKSILSFSKDGKFGTRIGNVGKGPGEYLNPIDIVIIDDLLYIFDDFQHSVLKYDLLNEVYLGSTKTTLRFNDFITTNDGGLWINSDLRPNFHLGKIGQYKLFLTDSLFRPSAYSFPYVDEESAAPTFARNSFYRFNGNAFYNPHYSDYIYKISQEKIEPHYFFDFGSKSLAREYQAHNMTQDNFRKTYDNMQSDFMYIINVPFETDDILVSQFRTRSLNFNSFYFKRGKKILGSPFYESKGEGVIANNKFLALSNQGGRNRFFNKIDAITYLEVIEDIKKKFGDKISSDSLLVVVKEDSNPILTQIIFKDDLHW